MKWQWFRIDAWGFTLGILFILLGIYMFIVYVNAGGQRGAEIMVYLGSFVIFAGLVNNIYITISWLRMRARKRAVEKHL